MALLPAAAHKTASTDAPDCSAKTSKPSLQKVLTIPVYYVTDRATQPPQNPGLKQDVLDLQYGKASVDVAITIADSDKSIATTLHWQTKNEPERTLKPTIFLRGYECPPGAWSKTNDGVAPYQDPTSNRRDSGKDRFLKALTADTAAATATAIGGNLYLYIHGFASRFQDAIYSCAYLESIVKAPVVCYSWPSVGTVALSNRERRGRMKYEVDFPLAHAVNAYKGYNADVRTVDSPEVETHLASTIESILSAMAPDQHLHVIADSLGNRLLVNSLAQLHTTRQIDRVIYLSADVPIDDFEKEWPTIKKVAKESWLFFNPTDQALSGASLEGMIWCKLARHKDREPGPCDNKEPRIGRTGSQIDPELRMIQYAALSEPACGRSKIRHFLPFEALNAVLQRDKYITKPNGQKFGVVTVHSIVPLPSSATK